MKLFDITKDKADAERIVKQALTAARKMTKHIGYVDQGFEGKEYVVVIETDIPEYVIDELETLINKSARAMHVSSKAHKGFFDWAADTYIKDAAHVVFKF